MSPACCPHRAVAGVLFPDRSCCSVEHRAHPTSRPRMAHVHRVRPRPGIRLPAAAAAAQQCVIRLFKRVSRPSTAILDQRHGQASTRGRWSGREAVSTSRSSTSAVRIGSAKRMATHTRWASTTSTVPERKQDRADLPPIVERVDGDAAQELGQAGLTSTAAPHLSDHRMSRAERCAPAQSSGEELLGGALSTIHGNEKARVEDHRP